MSHFRDLSGRVPHGNRLGSVERSESAEARTIEKLEQNAGLEIDSADDTSDAFSKKEPLDRHLLGREEAVPALLQTQGTHSAFRLMTGAFSIEQKEQSDTTDNISKEKAISLAEIREELSYLESYTTYEGEGLSFGKYQSGKQDGMLSESEVLALQEKWKYAPKFGGESSLETEFSVLLEKIRTQGVEIEKPERQGFQKAHVDVDLVQLNNHLQTKMSPEMYQEGLEQVEALNEVSNIHQKTADVLELAIHGYAAEDYKELNKVLRAGELDSHPELKLYADGIETALSKLPGFKGTVYRGVDLPGDVARKYRKGSIVREKGFTSTTQDKDMVLGEDAFFEGNVVFIIQTKEKDSQGKCVSKLAYYEDEKEVLFQRDTEFFVLKNDHHRDIDGDKFFVYLQEL